MNTSNTHRFAATAIAILAFAATVTTTPAFAADGAPSVAEDSNASNASDGATADSGAKNKWLAAGLNFFIPGAGYVYNGKKPLYVSLPMIAGAVGLTYVEQIHKFSDGNTMQNHDSTAFMALFAAVLLINTGTAIDAWQEADAINKGGSKVSKLRLQLQPTANLNGDQLGLAVRGSW